MKYEILDRINSPEDLQILPKSDLDQLAGEIREFIIETVKRNGGHLASNLGAVEITLAVHRVFDSPKDHIVFDVGHQSYTHKIITGRRDSFEKLRKTGGLSGFPSIKESAHDAFGTGHSSTSISAAIGLATADKLQGRASHSVCIIGDGAFTGGMVHEALNNIAPELPLVIILNENGMAISKNRGLFADFISRQRVNTKQGNIKRASKASCDENPISKIIKNLSAKIKNVFYSPSYFEKLGLEYVGPIDGHDIEKLEKALSFAKSLNKPVIVHVKTLKGKGYLEAEKMPSEYHSFLKSENESSFSDVLTSELISRAKEDKTICAITPAMAKGTGFYRFGEIFPERYFDTGIAEAHALTFSAAMAKSGMKPFVATYSTFLQRGYDNLIHDIALQNLPVKIIADRAGLAVSDGATHHGNFDVSFLSAIPSMSIFAPLTYKSLKKVLDISLGSDYPVAIRYPSACESAIANERFFSRAIPVFAGVCADFDIENPPEYVFVTYGSILDNVIRAADFLRSKGLDVGIMLTEIIKPYDNIVEAIMPLCGKTKRILYVEEGIENGGAAVLTMNSLRKRGFDFSETECRIAAIEDDFISPSTPCDIYEYAGLSPEKLVEKMLL